jgi:hypothetical protein
MSRQAHYLIKIAASRWHKQQIMTSTKTFIDVNPLTDVMKKQPEQQ